MSSDVNNAISVKKLKNRYFKIDNDINKQEELSYNDDFQIQLMNKEKELKEEQMKFIKKQIFYKKILWNYPEVIIEER